MAKLLRSKDARNRRYSGTKIKNRETPSPCQSCRPRALLHHLARRGGRRKERAGGGRATRCSPPSPPLLGRGSRPRRHLHHGASCCSGLLSPPLVLTPNATCLPGGAEPEPAQRGLQVDSVVVQERQDLHTPDSRSWPGARHRRPAP
jgi:hypothetical protein